LVDSEGNVDRYNIKNNGSFILFAQRRPGRLYRGRLAVGDNGGIKMVSEAGYTIQGPEFTVDSLDGENYQINQLPAEGDNVNIQLLPFLLSIQKASGRLLDG
jgi:hypothetical protein